MKAVFVLAVVAALVALSFQDSPTTSTTSSTSAPVDTKSETKTETKHDTKPETPSQNNQAPSTTKPSEHKQQDVKNSEVQGKTTVRNSGMNLQSTFAIIPLAFVLNRIF